MWFRVWPVASQGLRGGGGLFIFFFHILVDFVSVSSVIPKSGIWKSPAEIVHVQLYFNSTRFCFMQFEVPLLGMCISRVVVILLLYVMTFSICNVLLL